MKKRLITAAFAIASLVAGAAAAQDRGDDHGHGGGGGGGQHGAPGGGGGGQHGGPGGGAPHAAAARPMGGAAHGMAGQGGPVAHSAPLVMSQPNSGGGGGGGGGHHRGPTGGPVNGRATTFSGPATQGQVFNQSSGRQHGGGNFGGHARQFTFQGQSHQSIRGSAFQYPRGYSYRRWHSGQRLPLFFLTAQYFFDDYSDFGFGPPPYGERWVRYGPDLLLVDIRSGEVVDVVYGAFY